MIPPDLTSRHLAPGLSVQPLAMGCWPIGGPAVSRGHPVGWGPVKDTVALESLRTALELGADLFHTADSFGYGHSERLLGQAVREAGHAGVRIAGTAGSVRGTAPHPYAAPRLVHQVEQSLNNLGVGRLDVLFLHTLDFGPTDQYLLDAAGQLESLRAAGLIGAVGLRGPHPRAGDERVPAATAPRFRRIVELLNPDVISSRASPLSEPTLIGGENIVSFTARRGVALLLTEPLAQGLLTGKHHRLRPPAFPPGDHRQGRAWYQKSGLGIIGQGLAPLRERFGGSPAALTRVALRYSLQQPDHTVVTAGFTSPAQVRDLFDLGPPLTEEDLVFVAAAYQRIRRTLREARPAPIHRPGR
ncbi:aldo/keto reductase [Streptomyces sp. H27-H1]|uniref:aldo/keto reductase n=1 Tax=Streptomyces sp. H27-H1 TaxID=2996461 RepID=UPI002271DA2A|nr:aldo/keto reductase [Streptomyces sp. H27-H1]MCY0932105.1 aldo/keto reductase [Streptomyces sp. H27-H1]